MSLADIRVLVVAGDQDECEELAGILRTFTKAVDCESDPVRAMDPLRAGQVDVLIVGATGGTDGGPGISPASFLRRVRVLGAVCGGEVGAVAIETADEVAVTLEPSLADALFDASVAQPLTPVKLVGAVQRAVRARDARRS